MAESPEAESGITPEQPRHLSEMELREMAEQDPVFRKTVGDAHGTWEEFFAEKMKKHLSQDEFEAALISQNRFLLLRPEDFQDIENTMARPDLFGKSVQEAYPGATDKDLHSIERWLDAETVTSIIIGEYMGKRILLDGDHRAIAGAMRGRMVPAIVVKLD